jgi:hypothetical protein
VNRAKEGDGRDSEIETFDHVRHRIRMFRKSADDGWLIDYDQAKNFKCQPQPSNSEQERVQ